MPDEDLPKAEEALKHETGKEEAEIAGEGKPETPLGSLKDPKRKFVEIDRDNFNDVMKGISPRLAYKVVNKPVSDGDKIGVELEFNDLDDFSPENVADKVEPLKRLVEVRKQLAALLAKTDGNDALAKKLREILTETGKKAPVDSEPNEGWLHKAYKVLKGTHILGESAEKAEQLHEGVVSPTARQERETLELETHKSRENISEFAKPVIDKYRQAIDALNGDEQAPGESNGQSVQPQKKKLQQYPK